MPSMDRLSSYKTTIADSDDGKTVVTYHRTPIVRWDHREIVLNSGGWQTVTTKRKMNQAAAQFGLGYSVFQQNYVWYVRQPDGEIVEYEDHMVIERR